MSTEYKEIPIVASIHLSPVSSAIFSTPVLQQRLQVYFSLPPPYTSTTMFNTAACFSAFILILTSVAHTFPTPVAGSDTLVTIQPLPSDRFCLLLPRKWGLDLIDNVNTAIMWCTDFTDLSNYERILPDHFIKTRTYQTVGAGPDEYIQVTGQFRHSRFNLNDNDDGAQQDRLHPAGSGCFGPSGLYPYFVQFIEPRENIYCLRCCKNETNCPINTVEKGCRKVIPNGTYD